MQFDWTVGEILAALERLGVANDTLVVVTSDNGGLPGTTKHGQDTNGPWRGHKGSAWEGGHRVPLIARWPGKIKAGSTCDALFSLTDLVATASALAGGFIPPQGARDSIDQSPVFLGQEDSVRDALMMATRGCAQIVRREGQDKIVFATGSGETRYLNLTADPAEKSPLPLEEAPPKAKAMLDRLHRYFADGATRPCAIGRAGSVENLFEEKDARNRRLERQFGDSKL